MSTENVTTSKSVTASKTVTKKAGTVKRVNVRYLTMTAMLSAIAFVLMFFDFTVPFMPSFIQLDISELPALIGAFAMGPVSGVAICLIKNLLHLLMTATGGVGELSNFILGAAFVLPAGLIYKYKKTRKSALIGSLISIVSNYYVVYPFYTAFMPTEGIIGAYNVIASVVGGHMDSLLECLVVFNMPFTFFKGMLSVGITFVIYKHISPVIKGSSSVRR